jgi:hypothetical protein
MITAALLAYLLADCAVILYVCLTVVAEDCAHQTLEERDSVEPSNLP